MEGSTHQSLQSRVQGHSTSAPSTTQTEATRSPRGQHCSEKNEIRMMTGGHTEDKGLSAELEFKLKALNRAYGQPSPYPNTASNSQTGKRKSSGANSCCWEGFYPTDEHPDEGLGKRLPTASEHRFITSQLQICLLDQAVPFRNSLAKTTFSSSFICLGTADML